MNSSVLQLLSNCNVTSQRVNIGKRLKHCSVPSGDSRIIKTGEKLKEKNNMMSLITLLGDHKPPGQLQCTSLWIEGCRTKRFSLIWCFEDCDGESCLARWFKISHGSTVSSRSGDWEGYGRWFTDIHQTICDPCGLGHYHPVTHFFRFSSFNLSLPSIVHQWEEWRKHSSDDSRGMSVLSSGTCTCAGKVAQE